MEPAAEQVGQEVAAIPLEGAGPRDTGSSLGREPSQQPRARRSPLRSLYDLLVQGQFHLDMPHQYFSFSNSDFLLRPPVPPKRR